MASKIIVDQLESSGSNITIPTGTGLVVTDGIAATNLSGTIADARLPTVPVAKGGTGLTSLGTAGQAVKVNSAGNALEFGSVSGGGKVGQVKQGYKTTAETFSSSGTDYDIAGLTVTLTPASSSSKILIISNIGGYSQNGSPQIFIKCNSTGSFATVGVNTIASRRNTSFAGNIYTGDAAGTAEMFFSSNTCFLHSPNVSSEIIYKISGNANGETRINIKESDASNQDAGTSNITVMEILA
jgi:hypothetical protein